MAYVVDLANWNLSGALFTFLVVIISVDDAKRNKATANRNKDVVFPNQSNEKKANSAYKIKEHN